MKEPAISDGRIRPGDKLLSCNGVDLSNMSHSELITFLRQCPEQNTLTMYRDNSRSQTPLTPDTSAAETLATANHESRHTNRHLSATLSHDKRTSMSPSRKHLRYEAVELVRSLQSSRNSLDKVGLGSNPGSYNGGTLGRRLGRPYSPAMRDRKQMLSPAPPAPTVESPVTPHNWSHHLTTGPTVESPTTPHNSSAPASLSHALTNLKLEHAVSIEEVSTSSQVSLSDSGGCSPDIQEVLSAPHSPVKEDAGLHLSFNGNESKSLSLPRGSSNHFLISPGKTSNRSSYHRDRVPIFTFVDSSYCEKPERPTELNFNLDENRRQAYIFNSNWNFNKNKH